MHFAPQISHVRVICILYMFSGAISKAQSANYMLRPYLMIIATFYLSSITWDRGSLGVLTPGDLLRKGLRSLLCACYYRGISAKLRVACEICELQTSWTEIFIFAVKEGAYVV